MQPASASEKAPLAPSHPSAITYVALTLGFMLTGTVTTLIGPLLPVLAAQWTLSDERVGAFFVAQFTGSTCGSLLSGRIARRLGSNRCLLLGFALIAIGVWGLSSRSAGVAALGVLLYGFGLGSTIPAINLAVAHVRARHSAPALNILNMIWTIGALASPLLVSVAVRKVSVPPMLHALAILAIAFALWFLVLDLPEIMGATAGRSHGKSRVALSTWLLFALVFFLYVGVENSVAGWIAAYAQRSGAVHDSAVAALVPAAFWGALIAGRAFFSVLMMRPGNLRRVSNGAIAVATLGCALLAAAADSHLMVAGVCLAGFGLAPIFPNAIAAAKHLFASDIGPLFACAGAGGAVIPYAVGLAASRTSHLSSGIQFAFVVCFVLALLQFRVSAVIRERTQS